MTEPDPGGRTPQDRYERGSWRIALVVALITFIAFLPALRAGFVTWDDNRNFTGNPYYRGLGWSQLTWMWTTFHTGHYIPLTWMTLGLDYLLSGMNPTGYHLVNLLLHTANAVLVFYLARRLLTLAIVCACEVEYPAAFAALVYAIHPLRVESVAWVTERRDVLSLFFMLLSIHAYIRSTSGPAVAWRWYAIALATFACALLSKATAVTLPVLLLLLNVFPLSRIRPDGGGRFKGLGRVARELSPFFALSALVGVLSVVALDPPNQLAIGDKLAVSGFSLGFYLLKTIDPTGLAPLYEMPRNVPGGSLAFVASYVVIVGLTALAWIKRRVWPAAATAWAAFLIVIFPFLGIVQNGPQIAADRYTYHAAPALALIAGGAFAHFRRRRLVDGVAIAIVVVLGALTWKQANVWRDSETLWSRVLEVDSTSSIGHIAMGDVLIEQNRESEALAHYTAGVAFDPDYAVGHNNLGVLLARVGRTGEAVEQYRRAVAIRPGYADAYVNWGISLAKEGQGLAAIKQFQIALRTRPDYAEAHVAWGNALVRMGDVPEAILHYTEASRIRPDDPNTELNWGVALARQQRFADAIPHFERALQIRPDLLEAREYLREAQRLIRDDVP